MDNFKVNTNYSCTINASTSGGAGPSANASATTESKYKCSCCVHILSNLENCNFIIDVEDIYLPFVPVGSIIHTDSIELPESDDGSSDPINTPPFPFGDSTQSTVFVGS